MDVSVGADADADAGLGVGVGGFEFVTRCVWQSETTIKPQLKDMG